MFQLIVAVISIALVAALAIASIYYGGSAFSSSSLRANVVTLVNAGQQISGAQALYKTDYGVAGTMTQLINGDGKTTYLSAPPGVSKVASGTWGTTGTTATISLVQPSTDTCAEVVRQAGSTATPQFSCSSDGLTFNFKL